MRSNSSLIHCLVAGFALTLMLGCNSPAVNLQSADPFLNAPATPERTTTSRYHPDQQLATATTEGHASLRDTTVESVTPSAAGPASVTATQTTQTRPAPLPSATQDASTPMAQTADLGPSDTTPSGTTASSATDAGTESAPVAATADENAAATGDAHEDKTAEPNWSPRWTPTQEQPVRPAPSTLLMEKPMAVKPASGNSTP